MLFSILVSLNISSALKHFSQKCNNSFWKKNPYLLGKAENYSGLSEWMQVLNTLAFSLLTFLHFYSVRMALNSCMKHNLNISFLLRSRTFQHVLVHTYSEKNAVAYLHIQRNSHTYA